MHRIDSVVITSALIIAQTWMLLDRPLHLDSTTNRKCLERGSHPLKEELVLCLVELCEDDGTDMDAPPAGEQ